MNFSDYDPNPDPQHFSSLNPDPQHFSSLNPDPSGKISTKKNMILLNHTFQVTTNERLDQNKLRAEWFFDKNKRKK